MPKILPFTARDSSFCFFVKPGNSARKYFPFFCSVPFQKIYILVVNFGESLPESGQVLFNSILDVLSKALFS